MKEIHVPRYSCKFPDNTTVAICSCGWTSVQGSDPEAVSAWRAHCLEIEMPRAALDVVPPVADLDAKRWSKNTQPSVHKPREALAAILRDIDAGNLDPFHVIVVYATRDPENPDDPTDNGKTGFYQAGSADGYFGAMGILTRALQIMGDGG